MFPPGKEEEADFGPICHKILGTQAELVVMEAQQTKRRNKLGRPTCFLKSLHQIDAKSMEHDSTTHVIMEPIRD
jgi:hypothetical protein